jgi:hypothetical protein
MDGRTFDQITRLFAQQRSRRRLLGAVTGGLAVLVRGRTAPAQPTGCDPRLCGRVCGFCNDEDNCVNTCRDCEVCRASRCRNACTGGRICSDSGCVCPLGSKTCPNGMCAPHSGCCSGAECPGEQPCRAGGCVAAVCAANETYCGECAGGGRACCPPVNLYPGVRTVCGVSGPGGEFGPPGGRVCLYYARGDANPFYWRYTCMPA